MQAVWQTRVDAAPELEVVSRIGVGYDAVDGEAVDRMGVAAVRTS